MDGIKGKIYLLLAFSLAGTSVVTGSILSEKLSSFTITTVSLGIMIFCLFPFYRIKMVQTIRLLKKNDWKLIIMQAIFGIFLFRVFLLFGVSITSTLEAGILVGTTPAITSVLAYFVLREKLSYWTALGIGFTVAGIILLQGINQSPIQLTVYHVWGNMLILGAAASEAVFSIISRRHRLKMQHHSSVQIHPMVQVLLVSIIAFILSIAPALREQPFAALQVIGLQEYMALGWYGMIVTALAFYFFYEGVKRCDAYTAAAFSGAIPLTSVLLSLFLLKEPLGLVQWAGGTLIIVSMLLIAKSHNSEIIKDINVSPEQRRLNIW